MASTTIDLATVTAQKTVIATQKAAIEGAIGLLKKIPEAHLSGWSNAKAKTNFAATAEKLETAFNSLFSAIDSTITFSEKSVSGWQDTENKVAKLFDF